jgi:heme-degrading monooxygenase HmoA
MPMPVFSLWESHFAHEAAEEGRAITEAIWNDMAQLEGYLAHELIEDLDDRGHLFVVSQWTTRRRADEVLEEYADHPNARRANELVSRPRTRFLGNAVPGRA